MCTVVCLLFMDISKILDTKLNCFLLLNSFPTTSLPALNFPATLRRHFSSSVKTHLINKQLTKHTSQQRHNLLFLAVSQSGLKPRERETNKVADCVDVSNVMMMYEGKFVHSGHLESSCEGEHLQGEALHCTGKKSVLIARKVSKEEKMVNMF